MLIWGFRQRSETLAMLTLACRNGHTAAHRLTCVRRMFTLFFIPLFPVSRRYFGVCAQCGITVPWTRQDAERAVASSQPAAQL